MVFWSGLINDIIMYISSKTIEKYKTIFKQIKQRDIIKISNF